MHDFTIKVRKKSDNYNEAAFDLLGLAFVIATATFCIKAILSGIGFENYGTFGSAIIYAIWLICLFVFILENQYIFLRIIAALLIYLGLLFISRLAFPNTAQYYTEYFTYIRQIAIVYIPIGVILSKVDNYNNAFEHLNKFAWLGSFIMLIAYFLGYINMWGYMLWGSQITPFFYICFMNYFLSKRRSDLALLVLDFILCFAGGRQCFIICTGGFIFLYFIINRTNISKIILVGAAGIIAFVLIVMLSDVIISAAINMLSSLGISTRTLDFLSSGNLLSTSTRDNIYQWSAEIIRNRGVSISGFFADRYYLRQYGSWIAYSHNMFLELWIDFGLLFGTIISAWILIRLILHILRDNENKRLFIIAFACICLVRLMVSSSFMIEGNFYILLSLLTSKVPKHSATKSIKDS